MGGKVYLVSIAACLAISIAQPVDELPILKEQNPRYLFRVGEGVLPLTLECVTVTPTKGNQIKYTWQKNGQPIDLPSQPNVEQKPNEGTIIFKKPTPDIEGNYQCFAETPAGVASTRPISVKRTYMNIPKITPLKHKPVEGKPFKLDCDIPAGHPTPLIVWVRKNGEKTTRVLDKRITTAPDGALYFSNVTKEDASATVKYVCTAESMAVDLPVAVAEHLIESVVEDKGEKNGELVPQYLSNDMVVQAGNVTMIYCIYGGTPLAHPDWFFEGKNVNNKPGDRITRHNRTAGKRLLIKDTFLTDQGTFTCEVNNGVGKPQKHSIKLTVVSVPEYTKKLEPKMIVKQGEDVTIPCQVKGVNAPIVTWTYNAKPLTTIDRLAISSKSSANEVVRDLTIRKVQKSDLGYYGCKAVNDHGEVYAETLLQVVS